ncbi:hypothetical protein LENED_009108 [Lentinula edodes]|uniref:Uncharacterized protein n=1 Tax=Lentinula edodes TaxID=5353 RepID=A0A1Q3EIU1_LENED|nr:hypothetical protein LENED_009108 [Lentinula edodes]
MFFMALSTVLQWLHLESKHALLPDWSSPTTPEDNGDVYALPLPASATKASFGEVLTPKSSQYNQWPSMHAPIVFVICLFPLSTAVVFLSLSSLPIPFAWPKTLTDLAQLGKELHRNLPDRRYTTNGRLRTLSNITNCFIVANVTGNHHQASFFVIFVSCSDPGKGPLESINQHLCHIYFRFRFGNGLYASGTVDFGKTRINLFSTVRTR